jgi:hypothetical protein
MFNNLIPVTLGNIVGGLMIVLIHPKTDKKIVQFIKDEMMPNHPADQNAKK